MTSETEELLWIASQEIKLIPRDIVLYGIENKKTMYELFTINDFDLKQVDEKTLKKFLQDREKIQFTAIQKIYDHLLKDHVNLITYNDPLFPTKLKKLKDRSHPILLYHQGKKIRFENGIAVVGTRNCSTHAVESAREISKKLAQIGYVIVSGLARGIDASAHRGAISVGGKTIAVLPWIHDPYPPEHVRLLEEIKQNGSIISENYFKSSHLDKYKFLQRNAIISGISEILIAVESSFSGGTRWQVELAITQGKNVIALEPEKTNELAYDGFKKFVQKGAIKAQTASEVVDIVKKKIKIKELALDDFDFEEEIEFPPLIEK